MSRCRSRCRPLPLTISQADSVVPRRAAAELWTPFTGTSAAHSSARGACPGEGGPAYWGRARQTGNPCQSLTGTSTAPLRTFSTSSAALGSAMPSTLPLVRSE